jgi:hypothetical protein
MPWKSLTLIDPDIIEEANIPYQNYGREELGEAKALVTHGMAITGATLIESIVGSSTEAIGNLIKQAPKSFHFACIDNLNKKARVLEALPVGCVWIDVRASGTQIQSSLLLIENKKERDEEVQRLEDAAKRLKDAPAPPCGYANVIENGLWTAAITTTLVRLFFNEGISGRVVGNNETFTICHTITKGERTWKKSSE